MRFALITLALVAASCSNEFQGCDICTTSAIIYGVVRDTAGKPVSGIRISAAASHDSCSSFFAGDSNGLIVSDTAGRYRGQVLSLYGPFHACLSVTTHAPSGSLWRDTTTTGAVVDFRADFPAGPHDSVRVDIVLSQ